MAKLASKLHRDRKYYDLTYHAFGKGEAAHFHISQGDRNMVILLANLEIKIQNGRFKNEEKIEIFEGIRNYVIAHSIQPVPKVYGVVIANAVDSPKLPIVTKLLILYNETKELLQSTKDKIKSKKK